MRSPTFNRRVFAEVHGFALHPNSYTASVIALTLLFLGFDLPRHAVLRYKSNCFNAILFGLWFADVRGFTLHPNNCTTSVIALTLLFLGFDLPRHAVLRST